MRLRLVFNLFLLLNTHLFSNGNQMYFTPDHPLCSGDSVQMVCLIIVPPSSPFKGVFEAAQISFNGSEPTFPETLDLLPDVDTSRYIGGTKGLNITADRPGAFLNIEYVATDSSITFGCHAFLYNLKPTEALVTGKMMRSAFRPSRPQLTVSLSSLESDTCTNSVVEWEAVESEREVGNYYLYKNGVFLSQLQTSDTTYTDTRPLQLGTDYKYSLIASSCAGNSSRGYSRTFSVGEYSIANNSIQLKFDVQSGSLGIYWSLSNTINSPPILTLTYSLQINSTYAQSNGYETQEEDTITFHQTSSRSYLHITLSVPLLESVQNQIPTNIAASIRIVGQCGQYKDSQHFTTTTTTTRATTASLSTVTVEPTLGVNSGTSTTTTTTTTLLFTMLLILVVILTFLE